MVRCWGGSSRFNGHNACEGWGYREGSATLTDIPWSTHGKVTFPARIFNLSHKNNNSRVRVPMCACVCLPVALSPHDLQSRRVDGHTCYHEVAI